MSTTLGGGAIQPSLRDKADTVVSNGIVFTIAAGNDYPTYPIADPAKAPKVIAVGATNDQSAVTSYSSNGAVGSGKPDVVAPGGSLGDPSGATVTAAETNSSDGRTYPGGAYTFMSDRVANDYTNTYGTSRACPHVSGLAALLIQARESQGHAWTYSEADALTIKSLILMTAYETAVAGEAGNTPPLTRDGTKDTAEGYGRICADAAIEAATLSLGVPATQPGTLGGQQFDKRVWARQISLTGGTLYDFTLTNPPEGDFDLYLYTDQHTTVGTSIGDPIIAAMSATNGLGVAESLPYTPSESGTFYVIVKWVSGSGTFTLGVTSEAPGDYLVGDVYPPLSDLNSDGDMDDCGEFGDGAIDWMDVVSVYYCFIGVSCPEEGSCRYDAMDSYPGDQVDGSCNLVVRGGDGIIDWMDVICTYYGFVDNPTCKPRRPCQP
jgi:hypothetical protein